MLACHVAVGLVAGLAPAARADGTDLHPGVGGHVGVAVPMVFLKSNMQTVSDQFTLACPIGIGFKLTENDAMTGDKTNGELDIVFHIGIGC